MSALLFDHLTETQAKVISRRRAIKGLATTAIGGAVGLGVVRTASAATPVLLQVRIVTGSDDLRSGSRAYAYAIIQNSSGQVQRLPRSLNYNGGQWEEWSNTSDHTVPFSLTPTLFGLDPSKISPRQIKEFGILFFSGQSGPFDTGDNWNVNVLQVTLQSRSFNGPLLTVSGSPFKRFVSDHDEWHITFF